MLKKLILLTALAASPALAQTEGQPPASQPATQGQTGTEPAKEKLICRREAPVGSLIASRKRCYTRAEWDQIADAARDTSTRMISDNTSRPGGQ